MQALGCPGVQVSSLFSSAIYCQVTTRSAGVHALWRPICSNLMDTGRPACSLDSLERSRTGIATRGGEHND